MEETKKHWRIPFTYRSTNRAASLLELFFDILIVALLGGAIHGWVNIFTEYSKDGYLDIMNIIYILFQVLTVVFMWRNFMLYSSRYDSNNIRHRIFTMLLMLFVTFMDVSAYIVPHDVETKRVFIIN